MFVRVGGAGVHLSSDTDRGCQDDGVIGGESLVMDGHRSVARGQWTGATRGRDRQGREGKFGPLRDNTLSLSRPTPKRG
jgi:hypothetical protein